MSTTENDLLKRRPIRQTEQEYTYPEIIDKCFPRPEEKDESFSGLIDNAIIVSGQDKQAFDTLYNALQEIGDITQRAIRDGEKGHKPALHEIMGICRGVE